MAPFIFIVVGMMTLVFTLFPIKATVWLEERLLVTLYMFPVFLSVIFVPTETDGVGVTVGAEVIAGVGVAVGTGVTVGIGSLAIVSVLVTLHWIIADKEECITLESLEEGMKIYDNPVGVLTNNPPFNYQMFNLNNYMQLAVENRSNTFSENLKLNQYSRGMGGMGMPGDLSSQSRFVRVAFVKMNSLSGDSEDESVSQFFHILGSVDQQKGCCKLGEDKYEITLYTSCCNTDKGIYYYNTYGNHQISAVDMHKEDLDGEKLYTYAPIKGEQIRMQN